MSKTSVITVRDQEVWCYGRVSPNAVYEIICGDPANDKTHVQGNPESDDRSFQNWTEVVNYFYYNHSNDIEQVTVL